MRVVVVGAGLAGLSAAEVLLDNGVDVVLVEAGDRFGGRARTVRDSFIAGQWAESGAEWVDTTHERMHELMRRFGVEVEPTAMKWTTIRRWIHWQGNPYRGDDIARLDPDLFARVEAYEDAVERHAADIVDPADPTTHPEADPLDTRSLGDMMRECGLDGAAALLARRNSEGEFAASPERVSLLFVAQQRAAEEHAARRLGVDVRAHRVAGGVSSIAERWGSHVAPHLDLRFGACLVAVEHDDDRVVVEMADGTRLVADHVVLATSLVPLRSVDWRPGAPADLAAAIGGLGYGTITKTAVQFARRQWAEGYGTTDTVAQRLYDCTIDQTGEAGILMSYCGGEGGRRLGQWSEDERVRVIEDDMRRVHSVDAATLGWFSRSWSADPSFGGSYAVYEPGQVTRFWKVLREPWGRVHLAGEHVATCTGYMEGAVESGDNVARRLITG